MSEHRDISMAGIQYYLKGIDYPAGKNKVTQAARNNDAPEEVINILNKLPGNAEYMDAAELSERLGHVMTDDERSKWTPRPERGQGRQHGDH